MVSDSDLCSGEFKMGGVRGTHVLFVMARSNYGYCGTHVLFVLGLVRSLGLLNASYLAYHTPIVGVGIGAV